MAQEASLEAKLSRYDAEAIAAYYGRRPWTVLRRFFALVVPLLGFAWGVWSDSWWGQTQQRMPQRARQLRELLSRLGPAFIKIGQALSTRPDIVPPPYLEELTQLQDRLPAFPNETAFRFIREELGADPQEIYAEISPQPIAAASLGQVYQGRLHSGERVAIKVQRPDIVENIALDLYLLRGLAGWVQKLVRRVRSNLPAIVDEFAARIFEEMDYTCEGANAEQFAEYYRRQPGIYVPRIFWPYTAKRVLTMEWIDGTKLTELDRLAAMGLDTRHIIQVGVQCSLVQLLDRGFFHADPHPGNLLVMADGTLAYLDFGMMSRVTAEQRYGLIEAIVHLANRDFTALAQDYVRLGFLDPDTDLTGIVPALESVFQGALDRSVAELDFKELTDKLSQVMYDYPFQVPPYYALIVRSLVTLEGIALAVDPNFKVLSVAYPYVANRLLVDTAPELRYTLTELLFKDGSLRWQRLENLLRSARSNQAYDLPNTIARISEFLLSERGDDLRDRLSVELANLLADALWQKPTAQGERWESLQNIWESLRGDRSPVEVLPLLGQAIVRPAAGAMGFSVLSQLAQRFVARSIREIWLKEADLLPSAVLSGDNGHRSPIARELNGRTW